MKLHSTGWTVVLVCLALLGVWSASGYGESPATNSGLLPYKTLVAQFQVGPVAGNTNGSYAITQQVLFEVPQGYTFVVDELLVVYPPSDPANTAPSFDYKYPAWLVRQGAPLATTTSEVGKLNVEFGAGEATTIAVQHPSGPDALTVNLNVILNGHLMKN
jgi:hypothetical protein